MLVKWLEETSLASAMQSHEWAVPAVQSIHILGLAIIFASMLMYDLRLLGVSGRHYGLGAMTKRFLPPLWIALGVMLATGALLIVAEPARELLNPLFWTKMSLLLIASLLTYGAGRTSLGARGQSFDLSIMARTIGLVCLGCWLGIVFCGRWIAYFDVM